jgi:hypothetical protein
MEKINNRSKGGRGKLEVLRNRAVIDLHQLDPKTYNTNTLGKLFDRHRKTIQGVLLRHALSKTNKPPTGR